MCIYCRNVAVLSQTKFRTFWRQGIWWEVSASVERFWSNCCLMAGTKIRFNKTLLCKIYWRWRVKRTVSWNNPVSICWMWPSGKSLAQQIQKIRSSVRLERPLLKGISLDLTIRHTTRNVFWYFFSNCHFYDKHFQCAKIFTNFLDYIRVA